MKLTYIGPFNEVYVPLESGAEVAVANGADGEFPGDVAKRLLEQPDNWKAVKVEPAKKEEK